MLKTNQKHGETRKALYQTLKALAEKQASGDGIVQVSFKELADAQQMHVTTVRYHLKRLEQEGKIALLDRVRPEGDKTRRRALRIQLDPPGAQRVQPPAKTPVKQPAVKDAGQNTVHFVSEHELARFADLVAELKDVLREVRTLLAETGQASGSDADVPVNAKIATLVAENERLRQRLAQVEAIQSTIDSLIRDFKYLPASWRRDKEIDTMADNVSNLLREALHGDAE